MQHHCAGTHDILADESSCGCFVKQKLHRIIEIHKIEMVLCLALNCPDLILPENPETWSQAKEADVAPIGMCLVANPLTKLAKLW